MSNVNDGTSGGGQTIAVCRVFNRQTGRFEIVPATNPPQGEVFFMEASPPPMPMNYSPYDFVQQMQPPVYPVPMFGNVQYQYPPQPMEYGPVNAMETEYEPRDRVYSFDSVSSMNIEPSGTPQSPNEMPNQNDATENAQQPSSSGTGTPATSSHENDTTATPDNVYNSEDGPLARHGNEIVSRRLPPLIQRHASGTQPWVTKLYIDYTKIIVSLDTDEEITISCDSANLGRLMSECQAAPAIALESNAYKKQVFFISNETLGTFFKFSTAVYITGLFAVENLERLVPCLRARKINVHRWIVSHAGRLGSITHAGIPRTMENLYFDTRGTDNVTFVDNLSRVYKDVFEDVHQSRPFLVNFQLIVDDFCSLGNALNAQIERILQMLRNDIPSSAAILFSISGDDDIYTEITNLRFLYSHYGPMEAIDGTHYLVDYWKKEEDSKTLVFGFKSRRSFPSPPEIVTIERQ